MSRLHFNLIDDPWIPVHMVDGAEATVSMRELFAEVCQIRRVDGEVGTMPFAIHGLLSAIMRRAFSGPRGQDMLPLEHPHRSSFGATGFDDWLVRYESPEDALVEITEYLKEFHDRFDICDSARPFYQVPDLHTTKNEHSGLEVLIADVPNGEPFFTTRVREGNARISWAEAARWLLHLQAFDPSGIRSGAVGDKRVKNGKGYPIGPGWAAQIGGMTVERSTLWETLMVNLVPVGYGGLAFNVDADTPPWERKQLTSAEEIEGGRDPNGPVDLATWQSRRVRLVGDEAGVTGVVLAQGDVVKPQRKVHLEPRTAWRYSDPQSKKFKETVYMPRELDPSRALWRGLEAVIPGASPREDRLKDSDVPRYLPPAVSMWMEKLLDEEVVHAVDIVHCRAIGVQLGSNQSVIAELISDSVDLPGHLFAESADSLRKMVINAAKLSDDLARHFGYFASNLALAAGSDTPDGEEQKAKEQLLTAIAPHFKQWVCDVKPISIESDDREWRFTLFEVSQSVLALPLSSVSPSAYQGRTTSRGDMDAGRAVSIFESARRKLGVGPRPREEVKDGEGDE